MQYLIKSVVPLLVRGLTIDILTLGIGVMLTLQRAE